MLIGRIYVRINSLAPHLTFIVGMLITGPVQPQAAQPSREASDSIWVSYVGDHPISDRWELHLEGYGAWVDPDHHRDFFFVRPGVRRKFPHDFSSLLSYGYFSFSPSRTGATVSLSEHRLSQDVQWSHRLFGSSRDKPTLSHRLRYEERFRSSESSKSQQTQWNFRQRARYRMTFRLPLREHPDRPWPSYASVYNETFINLKPLGNARVLSQNSTSAALGWHLSKHFDFELGYLHQYVPSPSGIIGVHNHIATMTLFSRLPLRMKH